MESNEIENIRLEIERQRLEIERRRSEAELRFTHRHFGTIITSAIALMAVVVSVSNVWSAYVTKDKEIALAQAHKDRELAVLQSQKDREFEEVIAQNSREWNLNIAKFVSEHADVIFGGDLQQRQHIQEVMLATFPPNITSIIFLDLKLNRQLVVLSACETDVGDTLFGEGNDSLASGFLLAGAGSVVATRWRLRDDVPVKIMEVFYDQLSRGESVENSLRAAKISYAAKDRDPRNWAAFTALGNGAMRLAIEPRRIERTSRFLRNNFYVVLIIVAAITAATFIMIKRSRQSQLRSSSKTKVAR